MKKILLSTVAALVLSTPAFAGDYFKSGDFMVRARALAVVPDESGHVSNGDTVKINNSITPELDFSYFFTPNISAELIAAVTKHNVKTNSGINAGSAWLLPPTLTLQYHFTQLQSFIPYVGAGVNYTHFYNEKGGDLSAVKYNDSFGGALQAGADIPLSGNWSANFDVKKVFVNTKATFSPSGVTANADINPWIVGVGIGYKF
jgi:outer membrane protein